MELEKLRGKIDKIDDEILELFQERMKIAEDVLEAKKNTSQPVLNAARERDILHRVCSASDNVGYTKILFNTIFDISRTHQNSLLTPESALVDEIRAAVKNIKTDFPQTPVVACQGVEGAYSQIAAEKLFDAAKIMYMRTFDGVFNAVEQGLCEYGVLPIENTMSGSVTPVYELMKKYKFHIVRAVKHRINHVLLTKNNIDIKNIKEVFSHEHAINQCSEFLKNNPHIKVTVCENTAIAAEMTANADRDDVAAISSSACADLYNLKVSGQNIQNSDHNYTRFICISKKLEIYENADKISLMMSSDNKPGALYSILTKFSVSNLNLTKLESRPIAGTDFEFMFYFDMDGNVKDEKVLNLIGQLEKGRSSFTFLGNYSEIG
ncbi:MAG: chorismate mutase [Oscillospiraceae bacterium]|nr:chorismate mutase [Oscillospiraceae bacterium]